MPDKYESNWDDLARQFGFEPEETEEPADEVDAAAEKNETTDRDLAKESITDFFDEAETSTEIEDTANQENTEEMAVADDTAEVIEVSPAIDKADSGKTGGGDHWGSLAEEFGLEEDENEGSTGHPDEVRSNSTVSKMESEDQKDSSDSTSTIDERDLADNGSSELAVDDVETIEFDVQDLSDEEDDRPRRRRKKRRRRRAVIEELREELEREKEAEAGDEPADDSESVVEDEIQPEPEKTRPRRRRRRRERDDSVSDSRDTEKPSREEDSESAKAKVSKNQRRRKKRVEPEELDRTENENVIRKEAKPERKFPTWQEAITPVVEANMERTNKPKRRKKSRRKDS